MITFSFQVCCLYICKSKNRSILLYRFKATVCVSSLSSMPLHTLRESFRCNVLPVKCKRYLTQLLHTFRGCFGWLVGFKSLAYFMALTNTIRTTYGFQFYETITFVLFNHSNIWHTFIWIFLLCVCFFFFFLFSLHSVSNNSNMFLQQPLNQH